MGTSRYYFKTRVAKERRIDCCRKVLLAFAGLLLRLTYLVRLSTAEPPFRTMWVMAVVKTSKTNVMKL